MLIVADDSRNLPINDPLISIGYKYHTLIIRTTLVGTYVAQQNGLSCDTLEVLVHYTERFILHLGRIDGDFQNRSGSLFISLDAITSI